MKSHLKSIWTAFGFEPPREHGHQTVESIAAMQNGIAQVFIAMGGNFVRASPDTESHMPPCESWH